MPAIIVILLVRTSPLFSVPFHSREPGLLAIFRLRLVWFLDSIHFLFLLMTHRDCQRQTGTQSLWRTFRRAFILAGALALAVSLLDLFHGTFNSSTRLPTGSGSGSASGVSLKQRCQRWRRGQIDDSIWINNAVCRSNLFNFK